MNYNKFKKKILLDISFLILFFFFFNGCFGVVVVFGCYVYIKGNLRIVPENVPSVSPD